VSPPPAVAAPAPAAPPPRPLPAKIAAALTALERLQEETVTALPPADYSSRVEDVKLEVAPALADGSSRGDVRDAIGAAVRLHAFAARARMTYERQDDLTAIGRDPVVAECRPLTDLVARDAAGLRLNPSDPAIVGLFAATEGAPALRACAGEQIAEAERRARAPR
jgi:hypothetical protein